MFIFARAYSRVCWPRCIPLCKRVCWPKASGASLPMPGNSGEHMVLTRQRTGLGLIPLSCVHRISRGGGCSQQEFCVATSPRPPAAVPELHPAGG